MKFLAIVSHLLILSAAARADDAALASAVGAEPTSRPAAEASLVMYPQLLAGDFFARNWMKTFPRPLPFATTRPANVTREPDYKAPPVYATFHFGDAGDANAVVLAIDDAANRAYLDANQDGDLTNDPRVSWDMNLSAPRPSTEPTTQPKPVEQALTLAVPARWKTGPGKYGIKFFRVAGNDRGFYTPVGAPTGSISIGGHPYTLFLYDQIGNGRYDVKPGKKDLGTVVYIDQDGDGTWRPIGASEAVGLGQPIRLGEKWYEFASTVDGLHLSAFETAAPPPKVTHAAPKPGDAAPDFEIVMPDGTKTKLSDRKGKVVLVDFWATWCGPCLKAMPKVEELQHKLKGQANVEIVGLCVMDEAAAFDAWIKKNRDTYSFTIGRDVAGKQPDDGTLAAQAYGLSAIPTTLVIDASGKIVESVSGFTPENEAKVVAALRRNGVVLP